MGALPPSRWTLQDAEARFGALVRAAREGGPQLVTVRGEEAVVVLDAAEYARLLPEMAEEARAEPRTEKNIAQIFGEGPFTELEEFGPVRETALIRPPEF